MPNTIKAVADLGTSAGNVLCTTFDFDSHQWTRYRASMAALEEYGLEFADAYDEASYVKDCLDDTKEPVHYALHEYRQAAKTKTGLFYTFARYGIDENDLGPFTVYRPPQPRPELRTVPRF